MRRRSFDLRRPARRKFPNVVWWILCCCLLVFIFMLILGKGRPIESRPLFRKMSRHESRLAEELNITDEMISPNSIIRQLRDQITVATSLLVAAKESDDLQFAYQLSSQIRSSQVMLSNFAAKKRVETLEFESAVRAMAILINQAQQLHYDGATMIMKLKARSQALEEKLSSMTEKTSRYGQIAAEEIPKSLYCIGIRLTTLQFTNKDLQRKSGDDESEFAPKLTDNNLFHFCLFSDNVIATSVVVNSTSVNSDKPNLIVFHIVTDEVNFQAMRAWFRMNKFRGATVHVQKLEDFPWLNASYVPVLKQLQDLEIQSFYFSGHNDAAATPIKFRNPKYLSMLNHLRFYIPQVFPALKKVIFLDDDVVVQKDLSALFSQDLSGNVNGAVETCTETFHRYHRYLNFTHPLIRDHFDPDACGWAFGLNVFDLEEWRKRNVTGTYHYWQGKNADRQLWRLGTLPPGLLAFYGLTQPLDPSWHVLGLGYTDVDPKVIEKGAVLHFNGNSKPWLKVGIEKYKPLWERYVDYSHPILKRCALY